MYSNKGDAPSHAYSLSRELDRIIMVHLGGTGDLGALASLAGHDVDGDHPPLAASKTANRLRTKEQEMAHEVQKEQGGTGNMDAADKDDTSSRQTS